MNRNILIGIIVVIIFIIGVVGYMALMPKHTVVTPTTTTSPTSSVQTKSPLAVWVADAYYAEAYDLATNFGTQNGITVAPVKAGGSFALAREISSNSGVVTVFMPVALSAISDLGNNNPGWAIAFIADQLTIAYTNKSVSDNQYAMTAVKDAKAGNWTGFYDILTSGKVKVGISDPNTDPAGFRAWINLEIAGYLFKNNTYYYYNTMLNNKGNVTATSAAELVSPLEAGTINFLYIYRSAAIAKGLDYIQLPSMLNLGNVSYAKFYAKFNYTLSTGLVKGSPVYLFITIPKNTNNFQEAIQFITFVVNNSNILSKYGVAPLQPAILFNSTTVPSQIASLISQGKLVEGSNL
ncbi:extracellular solute-binding protein [Acidianus sp. RZ1]|uniref:extracellular solute-binding protein n=1 Tax=Acidianus sp. RZ1 TaxID=1540082 RepID=UPI001491A841|nr:extracellular solute-binding protein [Acidianus sp. RZ1]NON62738.1 solute-binding protein [Acidianus sp. RZ1]